MVFLICLNSLIPVLIGVHLEKQNLQKIESLPWSQTHTHTYLDQESEQLKKGPKRRESNPRSHSTYLQKHVRVIDGLLSPPPLRIVSPVAHLTSKGNSGKCSSAQASQHITKSSCYYLILGNLLNSFEAPGWLSNLRSYLQLKS